MKTKREHSRWSLARRLHDLALRIAADQPVRVGGVLVRVPGEVLLEEELEVKEGRAELELEVSWPTAAERPRRRSTRSDRAGGRKP